MYSRTEGVTCVEHKKAENHNLDPQGMRLTVVFRIKLNEAKTMTAQHVSQHSAKCRT